MIIGHNVTLSFGGKPLFKNILFKFGSDQRLGLVGNNGSGKSTLLKAIAGQGNLDDGSISAPKTFKIAYLPQEVVLSSSKSIIDETFEVFDKITSLLRERDELEKLLDPSGHAAALESKSIEYPTAEHLVERYIEVQEQLGDFNVDKALAEAKRILSGLGFKQEQFDQPVAQLSVGWKMRIILAKLLLQKADFYLFDEPTNHLDVVAKQWFLKFLKTSDFGFLLVSHDRFFLDQVCTHIFELERGIGTLYTGNYSAYEQEKAQRLLDLETAYHLQQKEIQRKEETINRFKASASRAKAMQSMMKQLEKIERIELPPSAKKVNFHFGAITQPGKVVLTAHDVAHRFDQKQLFHHVSFDINRGERVALIAANGVGKSTLFNLIAHKLSLQQGTVEYGHNVSIALFDQDQNAALKLEKSIYENIQESCSKKTDQTIRTFLGSFLFSSDDIHKKVKVLSGGEKNRVGMVKTLLQDANVLLLDEPTNHLDMPTKDLLLQALQQCPATIFFVSHELDFISQLATRIIELTPDGVINFPGTYEEYVYFKQSTETGTAASATPASPKGARQSKSIVGNSPTNHPISSEEQATLHKQLTSVEKKINSLEKELKKIENSFADLSYGTKEFDQAQQAFTKLKKELEEHFEQWTRLQGTLDGRPKS